MIDEATARDMARKDPDRLLEILRKRNVTPAELFFCADFAGQIQGRDAEVLDVLLDLVYRHADGSVREGAVYGLGRHVHYPVVRDALMWVSKNDKSEVVRSSAADALD